MYEEIYGERARVLLALIATEAQASKYLIFTSGAMRNFRRETRYVTFRVLFCLLDFYLALLSS